MVLPALMHAIRPHSFEPPMRVRGRMKSEVRQSASCWCFGSFVDVYMIGMVMLAKRPRALER